MKNCKSYDTKDEKVKSENYSRQWWPLTPEEYTRDARGKMPGTHDTYARAWKRCARDTWHICPCMEEMGVTWPCAQTWHKHANVPNTCHTYVYAQQTWHTCTFMGDLQGNAQAYIHRCTGASQTCSGGSPNWYACIGLAAMSPKCMPWWHMSQAHIMCGTSDTQGGAWETWTGAYYPTQVTPTCHKNICLPCTCMSVTCLPCISVTYFACKCMSTWYLQLTLLH